MLDAATDEKVAELRDELRRSRGDRAAFTRITREVVAVGTLYDEVRYAGHPRDVCLYLAFLVRYYPDVLPCGIAEDTAERLVVETREFKRGRD
jgi:hypothetical protein